MSRASEPQEAASLTGRLLARRGGAQPAMRRQYSGAAASVTPNLEDLGWNDMGEDKAADHAAPEAPLPVRITPHKSSSIARQIAAISERMAQSRAEAAPADPTPTPRAAPRVKAKKKPAKAAKPAAAGRKAAFTLRLDAERHLRLRLMSATQHRSAQQLLIEALDQLIAGQDQLEHLARQVEEDRAGHKHSIGD
jgi:hypothetical protein